MAPACERQRHRLHRAQSAAVLHRHPRLIRHATQLLEVYRLATLGAVEIDHVQVVGARCHPGTGGGQGILVVDLLGVEVPLDQAHGVAVEDVDGRVEPHRASVGRSAGAAAAMQMRAKLASSRRPAAEDFSGWNCTP